MKPKMNNFLLLMIIVLALMIMFIQKEQGVKQIKKSNSLNVMKLSTPKKRGDVSIEETIAKRRSVRDFKAAKLSSEQISQLLWAAQGITEKEKGLRSAPSAGGFYPIEIYALFEEGVFHYIPQTHELDKIMNEDVRSKLCEVANGQESILSAPLIILIAAVYERTTAEYSERGIRYVHMESGHVAENIQLQAVGLGLGSVPIGSFLDKDVSTILNLSANIKPLYIIPIGYPK